jgi:hypothetical protein
MARTTQELQTEIITAVQADETLNSNLTSTSKVSVWRLITYAVAFVFNTIEKLFDALKALINDQIATLKPHSAKWYAEKAKAFQYGFNLLPDSDQFDNTGKTDAEIEASKVVAYAAVVEQLSQSGRTLLRIKVAGTDGVDLIQLPTAQLDAFKAYMSRIKDAGVPLKIDCLPADSLQQKWRIYYDPLILTQDGNRIDGAENEVDKNAIKAYLQNMPFNGLFVRTLHIDAVQQVEGIVNAVLDESFATYGALPFTNIDVEYTPDAGYLRFINDADLVIIRIPHNAIQ